MIQLRVNSEYKFESRLNVDRSRSVVIERSAPEKLRDPNNFPQVGDQTASATQPVAHGSRNGKICILVERSS